MVISSLIVETIASETDTVAKQLGDIPTVEVHGIQDYQVIVTIEADSVEASHQTASSFIHIEGVTGVNLVYANFEDDPDIKKVLQS